MTPTLTDAVPVPAPTSTGSPLDEPTFEECHAEFNRFHEANLAGQLDTGDALANEFVAFCDGRPRAFGTDARGEMTAALAWD